MLQVKCFVVNPVCVNTYLLWDDELKQACLVDPGFSSVQEQKQLEDFLELHHLSLQRVVCTHIHFDHIWGASYVAQRFGVAVEAPLKEIETLPGLLPQMQAFGLPTMGLEEPTLVPIAVDEEGGAELAGTYFQVLDAPGHAPGHVVFYAPTAQLLLSGDVLFANGYGRYDLWGGSYDVLMETLERVCQLPEDTRVLPGHGPETHVGVEKKNLLTQ